MNHLHAVWDKLAKTVTDPAQWNLAAVIALFAALIAFLPFLHKLGSDWRKAREAKRLGRRLRSQWFDEETIKKATLYYIQPDCCSIDPTQEAEIRNIVTAREPLFRVIDNYLAEGTPHRHLLILADSGMGKTSFALNYYAHNHRRPTKKRHRIEVVPLGSGDADDYIPSIEHREDVVLFLDALDEDVRAIEDHRARLRNLMALCRPFKRVLITCRTQFFKKDEEIPRKTGIVNLGPRGAGESGDYEFWKLYLAPFSDSQVDSFLRKRYPVWHLGRRWKARKIVQKIPLLSVRPMILSYIPDFIEEDIQIATASDLYRIMIEKWLARESHWIDQEVLRKFSIHLAFDLYRNRAQRKGEFIPDAELEEMARTWRPPIEGWTASGRSLLNRDAVGNYKFAHRSIMEYLFVQSFIALRSEDQPRVVWTDQMQVFLQEIIRGRAGSDEDTTGDSAALNLTGVDLSGVDLAGVYLKGATLNDAKLNDAKLNDADLDGADLRGADLRGADLRGADLSNATLTGADLRDAHLVGAVLRDARWDGVRLNATPLTDLMEMVRIPEGEFTMGSPDGSGDEEPQHRVYLDVFEIAKYPLTNLQYTVFLDMNPDYPEPPDWRKRTYPAGKGDHPVVGISWEDATACAAWLSRETGREFRLPTEAEWEKAARGTDGRRYPWGNEFDSSRCNTKEGKARDTTSVDAHAEGASPYGVMDMAGNVWEWCADWYDSAYYEKGENRNPGGPEKGEYRVVRGGSWNFPQGYARCSSRFYLLPDFRLTLSGVRFSRTP